MSKGDKVLILIGPHKGKTATVTKIEMNAGARNGWVTVDLNGVSLLYAGEELLKVSDEFNSSLF